MNGRKGEINERKRMVKDEEWEGEGNDNGGRGMRERGREWESTRDGGEGKEEVEE